MVTLFARGRVQTERCDPPPATSGQRRSARARPACVQPVALRSLAVPCKALACPRPVNRTSLPRARNSRATHRHPVVALQCDSLKLDIVPASPSSERLARGVEARLADSPIRRLKHRAVKHRLVNIDRRQQHASVSRRINAGVSHGHGGRRRSITSHELIEVASTRLEDEMV
jgi:hypothetical protein